MNSKNNKKLSSSLIALTTSAIALQSLSPIVLAESAPDKTKLGYRYTNYQEDDLDQDKISTGGSAQRYDIDVHQFHLLMPVASKYTVGVDIAHETMSGASPWYVQEKDGFPIQTMSGATISEERNDVSVNVTRYMPKGTYSASLGISDENDYTSVFGSIGATHLFDNKHRTFAWALSYSDDKIEPTQLDNAPSARIDNETKNSGSLFVGFTQIINKLSVIQFGLSLTHKEGYLSDPYKRVEIAERGNIQADNRPNERQQWTFNTNYRRFVPTVDAAWHLDYRFFTDDWGVTSHTIDSSWYQNINEKWQIVPMVRYYSQTSADFYDVYYPNYRSDGYYSSDYRLSDFGALSFELKLNWKISADFLLTSSVERYVSSADYALQDVDYENPGLVDFTRFTIGFDYSF